LPGGRWGFFLWAPVLFYFDQTFAGSCLASPPFPCFPRPPGFFRRALGPTCRIWGLRDWDIRTPSCFPLKPDLPSPFPRVLVGPDAKGDVVSGVVVSPLQRCGQPFNSNSVIPSFSHGQRSDDLLYVLFFPKLIPHRGSGFIVPKRQRRYFLDFLTPLGLHFFHF